MDNQLPPLTAKAAKTAKRYTDERKVAEYESKRQGTNKWDGETKAVRAYLEEMSNLSLAATILDCPCGTGRFFPLYEKYGFHVHAIDVSPAMVKKSVSVGPDHWDYRVASVFDLGEVRPDVSLCIRFLNLIECTDMQAALRELQRVTKTSIIFTLRVHQKNPTGHYHSAHPVSAVEEALLEGWSIHANNPVHEDDYRMIELRRGMD